MSSKLKTLDDCACGRDYLEYAQAHEWEVRKVGSYYQITDPETGAQVYVPDSDRTLPKTTRTTINGALVKLALVAAVLGVLLWAVL